MEIDTNPCGQDVTELQGRLIEIAKYKAGLKKRGLKFQVVNREVSKKLSSPEKPNNTDSMEFTSHESTSASPIHYVPSSTTAVDLKWPNPLI